MSRPLASSLAELLAAHDGALPLDQGAALLAAEEQEGVPASAVLHALDECARGLHIPARASTVEAVARLNHHLFRTLGFRGDVDDYYAPRNSFLDQVIARRRGLPIALSVVMIEVGRRAGLDLDSIGFPGHFLVGTRGTDEQPRFYLDPFAQGDVSTRDDLRARLLHMGMPSDRHEELMGPISPRRILLRMTYNLKGSYLRLRQVPEALRQIERVLLLAPDRHEEHRDRGLLLAESGREAEALVSLRRYLDEVPDCDDRDIIGAVVARLES